MAELSNILIGERVDAMRALSDDDRRAAIAMSRNVIGFERFRARAQQVQVSHARRSQFERR